MEKNEDFLFLQSLNEDLYKRYLIIEDTLKSANGNVYVEMQAFLEHLFRFISKRERIYLRQTTLGDFLKNNKIIQFCLVRLEYDHLDQLRLINTYGNNYKHQKLIEFNFEEFIKCMKEVYIISHKVYNYYKKDFVNKFKMFNKTYFDDLVIKEKERQGAEELYHEQITHLNETILKKNEDIEVLKNILDDNQDKIKQYEKIEKNLKETLQELENINMKIEKKLEEVIKENKQVKSELKEVKEQYRKKEKENFTLRQYQAATKGMVYKLLKSNELTSIDLEVIEKIKTEFNL